MHACTQNMKRHTCTHHSLDPSDRACLQHAGTCACPSRYNTHVIVNDSGTIVSQYRKIHL